MPPIQKYGLIWRDGTPDAKIELECFRIWHPTEKGGLPRWQHARNASKLIWPWIEENDWSKDRWKELCNIENYKTIGNMRILSISWAGCGAGGKTFDAAHFAFLFWLADPWNSIAMLCSTSKTMVGQRVWPVMQQLYYNEGLKLNDMPMPGGLCYMIDSQYRIQASKADKKHCIKCIAVAEGETQKAVEDIKGQHADRICIVIDEATATPTAIFHTFSNLQKGCSELVIIFCANPLSHIDNHGRVSEPSAGWNRVNRNTGKWKTKGVKEWQLPPGLCMHFPGRRSPNVIAGRTLFKYLYTWENHLLAIDERGEHDLGYWRNDEGFWAPEGVCNTVFNETMIQMYHARDKSMEFRHERTPIAGLDPAFTHDRCVLVFGVLGDLENGTYGVLITENIELKVDADSPETADLQIAKRIISECTQRGVKPTHFGMDYGGIGRGLWSHLCDLWSIEMIKVEFGGAASDRPASINDPRPAKEVYDRRVTELWYNAQEMMKGGQLKGLYDDAIIEFCSREYGDRKKKNDKLWVVPKEEMRDKLGFSPDNADAIVVLIEVARCLGATPWGKSLERSNDTLIDIARKSDRLHESDENEPLEYSEYYALRGKIK